MDDRVVVPREVSAYKLTRGWPKKFIQPWNMMMKQIYIRKILGGVRQLNGGQWIFKR